MSKVLAREMIPDCSILRALVINHWPIEPHKPFKSMYITSSQLLGRRHSCRIIKLIEPMTIDIIESHNMVTSAGVYLHKRSATIDIDKQILDAKANKLPSSCLCGSFEICVASGCCCCCLNSSKLKLEVLVFCIVSSWCVLELSNLNPSSIPFKT